MNDYYAKGGATEAYGSRAVCPRPEGYGSCFVCHSINPRHEGLR